MRTSPPPASTPSPSNWASPSPSPDIPVARTHPPAHVLYVGRELVRRGCQTAHWHGRCRARNEDRAKKGHQGDESYSDVFHGRFLRLQSKCSLLDQGSIGRSGWARWFILCGPERHVGLLRAYRPTPLIGPCEGIGNACEPVLRSLAHKPKAICPRSLDMRNARPQH